MQYVCCCAHIAPALISSEVCSFVLFASHNERYDADAMPYIGCDGLTVLAFAGCTTWCCFLVDNDMFDGRCVLLESLFSVMSIVWK